MKGPIRVVFAMAGSALLALLTGCVQEQPASDTGNALSPTVLSLPAPDQPLAYEPDMRQLFASDCVYCHGGYRVDSGYDMTTYRDVMEEVLNPGSPGGDLFVTTRPNGSMFIYFSENDRTRQAKSDMVSRWIVTYRAQQTR